MKLFRRFFQRSPRTLASVEAYAQWAKSYAAHAHNPLMAIEQNAMLQLMPNLKDKIVLDLACGTGRYGRIAQEQQAQVLGCDNSPDMLQAAAIENVSLATTESIPLPDESIDVILCGLALGHLPKIEKSMYEIGRILKPDGVALISDFHPFQYFTGARRTFQAEDGAVYHVEHYVHLAAEYHQLAIASHLKLTGMLEPTYNEMPVVLVLRFQKS